MTRTLTLLLCLPTFGCVVTVGESDAGFYILATTTGTGSSTTASSPGGNGSNTGAGTTSGSGVGAGSTTSGFPTGTSGSSGTTAVCGNGIVDPGEVCDLGTLNGQGLGCNATCNLFGLVTTIAGGPDGGLADGTGSQALFFLPVGVAVVNGMVYVADTYFRAIRQVNPASGQVITLAGGNTACADQNGPGDAGTFCDINALLAYDGGLLATDDSALRFVTTAGEVSTWAGQLASDGTPATGVDAGPFASALFGVPQGIAELDGIVYTNSKLDGYVLASNPATQQVSALALIQGNGAASQGGGMTALDGLVYTAVVSSLGGMVAIVPGDGGFAAVNTPALNIPNGLCNDGRSIYICESGANDIRQYDTQTGQLSLLAGGARGELDGLGADAGLNVPAGCAWDPGLQRLYVTDKFGYTLRMIQ